MIKIFATDMDHTFLDDNSQLPENVQDLIDEINASGSMFIAASGRTLTNLQYKYQDVKGDISFISDNGAILYHKEEIIYINSIKEADVVDTITKFRKMKDATIVVITPTMSYVDSVHDSHHDFLYEYYNQIKIVDDIMDYTKDVIKITTLSPTHSHENYLNHVENKLSDNVYGVKAGSVWIDVMNVGISKAVALQKIMDMYHINRDEVVAFGDYYNDLEMIKLAKYGYAVENAPDDIKKSAYGVIGTNNSGAVYLKIKEHLKKEYR